MKVKKQVPFIELNLMIYYQLVCQGLGNPQPIPSFHTNPTIPIPTIPNIQTTNVPLGDYPIRIFYEGWLFYRPPHKNGRLMIDYFLPLGKSFLVLATPKQYPIFHPKISEFEKPVNGCFWFPHRWDWQHIIPQLAVYKWYISGMYCHLGDYMVPIPPYLREPGNKPLNNQQFFRTRSCRCYQESPRSYSPAFF